MEDKQTIPNQHTKFDDHNCYPYKRYSDGVCMKFCCVCANVSECECMCMCVNMNELGVLMDRGVCTPMYRVNV